MHVRIGRQQAFGFCLRFVYVIAIDFHSSDTFVWQQLSL